MTFGGGPYNAARPCRIHRQNYLRFLPICLLKVAAYQHIKFLVGPAYLDIRFEASPNHNPASEDKRAEKAYRLIFIEPLLEVIPFQKAGYGISLGKFDKLIEAEVLLREPRAIMFSLEQSRVGRIQDL